MIFDVITVDLSDNKMKQYIGQNEDSLRIMDIKKWSKID